MNDNNNSSSTSYATIVASSPMFAEAKRIGATVRPLTPEQVALNKRIEERKAREARAEVALRLLNSRVPRDRIEGDKMIREDIKTKEQAIATAKKLAGVTKAGADQRRAKKQQKLEEARKLAQAKKIANQQQGKLEGRSKK